MTEYSGFPSCRGIQLKTEVLVQIKKSTLIGCCKSHDYFQPIGMLYFNVALQFSVKFVLNIVNINR